MAKARTRWMVVFGPPGAETSFIEHPNHPGKPGWSYSKREAQKLATMPPGGRVVDADKWIAEYKARKLTERPSKEPTR